MKSRIRRRTRWGRWIVALLVVLIAAFAFTLSHDAPCPAVTGSASGGEMQAIQYRCYGPPSVLALVHASKPALEDDMLLVKVAAASVNPLDWHYMRGEPY